MAPHIGTLKTSSGARAVQIVYSNRGGTRTMEHVGSAHDDAELELLKAAARQRLSAGQGLLDLTGLAPRVDRPVADRVLQDGAPGRRLE
jgi:hypothetical protein